MAIPAPTQAVAPAATLEDLCRLTKTACPPASGGLGDYPPLQSELSALPGRCPEDEHYPGELTTAEGEAFLKDLTKLGKPVVILTGGEPLLRDDIFHLAKFGDDLGLRMVIGGERHPFDQGGGAEIQGRPGCSGSQHLH
jgi:hypothetical protein